MPRLPPVIMTVAGAPVVTSAGTGSGSLRPPRRTEHDVVPRRHGGPAFLAAGGRAGRALACGSSGWLIDRLDGLGRLGVGRLGVGRLDRFARLGRLAGLARLVREEVREVGAVDRCVGGWKESRSARLIDVVERRNRRLGARGGNSRVAVGDVGC